MSPLRMFRRKKTRESVKQKPQNQAPSSSGRLMLALEPRYLYDAAGLATGLDIVAPAEDHYVPPVDDGHSDWQDISDELALLKDFTPPAVTSPEELVFI
ncbi:MAG: LEPR-XLL domain-containing protein, partial [Desulfobulbaceae bacterium]|nr:LEPR-XLL domain-containing protein [Desulfobulbaceae bacterium]